MKLKTKEQIIDETFNFYNKNPKKRRAVAKEEAYEEAGCVYNGPGNTHCAIGRLFIDEYKNQGESLEHNELGVSSLESYNMKLDLMLKPSYSGHSLHFWIDLQSLHDNEDYWYADKATDAGHAWKRTLHRKWDKEPGIGSLKQQKGTR